MGLQANHLGYARGTIRANPHKGKRNRPTWAISTRNQWFGSNPRARGYSS